MAREQARRTQCAVNAKQLTMIAFIYAEDQKNTVPYGGYETQPPASAPSTKYAFHRAMRRILFNGYGLTDYRTVLCPSGVATKRPLVRQEFLSTTWFTNYSTEDWSLNNNGDRSNYGYWVGKDRFVANTPTIDYKLPEVLRFADAQKPSTRIVWADPLMPEGIDNSGGATITMPGNTHDTNGDCKSVGVTTSYIDGHVAFVRVIYGVNVMNWRVQYFTY